MIVDNEESVRQKKKKDNEESQMNTTNAVATEEGCLVT